jgi:Rab GTPase-binding effector protein 1
LQLLVLRLREDVISAKVAKEHTDDTLRSEIMFLKDQVLAEQQEKATMEEALSQEISQLQEELGLFGILGVNFCIPHVLLNVLHAFKLLFI